MRRRMCIGIAALAAPEPGSGLLEVGPGTGNLTAHLLPHVAAPGVLTVIGYAVNDTIVVFDRIRETQKRNPGVDFARVVNNSLRDTMTRSLVTGVGVLFVLVALILIVGPTIKNLVVVLMVGIYFGTFTSLFIASPLLVVLHKKQWGTFSPKNETVKKLA